MFGLFKKKKSEKEELQEQYEQLMKDYYTQSKVNRSAADKIFADAEAIAKKLDNL